MKKKTNKVDLMKSLHITNPYKNFDNSGFKLNLQGWRSKSAIFKRLINKTNPSLIIEIGTWKGGSAINMGNYIKGEKLNCKILCIDTWLGALEFWKDKKDENRYLSLNLKNGYPTVYYQFIHNVVSNQLQSIIIPFPQTSAIASRWLKWRGVKADLIYIDGSHDEPDIYSDIVNYYNLLKKGGIIFGDDYTNSWNGVKKAVNRFTKKNKIKIQITSDRFWIIKKYN